MFHDGTLKSTTYNSCVATDADTGARAVRNGTPAVVVKLIVQLAQPKPRAKGGLPVVLVHAEALQVLEVNHEGTIFATGTEVAT